MFTVGRTNINLIKYINYPGSWKFLLLCNQKCTKRLKITKLMKMINFARKFSCQCTQNHRSEKGVAFGQCWLTHSAERAIYDLHAKKNYSFLTTIQDFNLQLMTLQDKSSGAQLSTTILSFLLFSKTLGCQNYFLQFAVYWYYMYKLCRNVTIFTTSKETTNGDNTQRLEKCGSIYYQKKKSLNQ